MKYAEFVGKKVNVIIDNYKDRKSLKFTAYFECWESEDDEDVPCPGYFNFYLLDRITTYSYGWSDYQVHMTLACENDELSKPEDMSM